MPLGVVYRDAAGRITDANPAAERMLGASLAQMRGQTTVHTLSGVVREDGSPLPWEEYPSTVALRSGQAAHGIIAGLHTPSGEIRWVRLSAAPVFAPNVTQPVQVFTTFEDITERRRAEEEAQARTRQITSILESTTDLFFALDRAWRFTYVNAQAERVANRSRAELLGRCLWEVFPAAAGTPVAAAYRQAMEERAAVEITTDIPEFGVSLELRAYPITDGIAIYGRDITERKTLEAESELLFAEMERLLDDAWERADHDPLTGLLNHRAFHTLLAQEAARCEQHGAGRLAIAVLDIDNFQFFNDVYGHAAGDDVLRAVAQRLCTAQGNGTAVARFGGDEFAVLMPQTPHDTAAAVEAQARQGFGGLQYRSAEGAVTIPITVSVGGALFPFPGQDRHEALRRAEKRLLRAKTGGAAETEADRIRAAAAGAVTGFSLLDALVTAVDNKDRYTRRHSEDVLLYSLMIARQLGMDESAQKTVAVAALLHDVGKIGVPDAILRKPAQLSEDEYAAVKQHPQMGAIMVTAVPGLEETLPAVRHHHERWDGDGYPFGLRGEEIPLVARLMAVADAFSAMTTDRPYRKGMPAEHALHVLCQGAGTQWDPRCVAAFLAAWQARGRDADRSDGSA